MMMPENIVSTATMRPKVVTGVMSPYPTVVIVTSAHLRRAATLRVRVGVASPTRSSGKPQRIRNVRSCEKRADGAARRRFARVSGVVLASPERPRDGLEIGSVCARLLEGEDGGGVDDDSDAYHEDEHGEYLGGV